MLVSLSILARPMSRPFDLRAWLALFMAIAFTACASDEPVRASSPAIERSVVSDGGFDKDLVPDEVTAIRIASAVMEAYLGRKQFEAHLRVRGLAAELEGDEWIVCHCEGFENYPKFGNDPETGIDTITLPGYVGLSMMISRKNGQITYMGFDH